MRFNKGLVVALAFGLAAVVSAAFFFGCGEEAGPTTAPEVQYKDQTFALLVCDGGGRFEEKDKNNLYEKDWHYMLEMMREIGTISKIDPQEDVFLGLFDPR